MTLVKIVQRILLLVSHCQILLQNATWRLGGSQTCQDKKVDNNSAALIFKIRHSKFGTRTQRLPFFVKRKVFLSRYVRSIFVKRIKYQYLGHKKVVKTTNIFEIEKNLKIQIKEIFSVSFQYNWRFIFIEKSVIKIL